MAFDSAFQPILTSIGKLALSCIEAKIDGSSIGWFSSAEFNIDGDIRGIKTGYPLRTTEMTLDAVNATAVISAQELGGPVKSILTGIIDSLNTGVVPTHNISLEVFRPVAENIVMSMTGAALLQEFNLNFSNDFNEIELSFEQLVPAGTDLASHVAFTTLGEVTYGATTPLLDKGNISVGLPRVDVNGTTLGAVQSVRLKLSTSYRRVETGYPRALMELTPLDHDVEIEIACEEFFEASLNESFAIGTVTPITFSAALFDGTAIVITLPEARLVPAGGPSVSQDDFATITKKFIATGATLLSIA